MSQPQHRDRVVIGASAGGLDALKRIAADLPPDYPGALFVVLHLSPDFRSELPALLARSGPLPAVAATHGMPIEPGRIHVAPPDHHLLIERDERLAVVRGPRENRHRPAIDPLFRSAAWVFGPRVVGVVLSGNLDDGTAGLWAIARCAGVTVVQEPADAPYPQMPTEALTHNRVDHRLPAAGIGALLGRLAHEPAGAAVAPPAGLADEVGFARQHGGIAQMQRQGALSPFTCPACRGALWELDEGGHLRYRCHTGHAFSQATLLSDQDAAVESSLFSALRAVEEKIEALRRLAEQWAARQPQWGRDYRRRADDLEATARHLRAMLAGEPVLP